MLQTAIEQNLSIRDLRDQVRQLSQPSNSAQRATEYVRRFNSLSRQMKKAEVLEDKRKRDRLEVLLKEIEELIQ